MILGHLAVRMANQYITTLLLLSTFILADCKLISLQRLQKQTVKKKQVSEQRVCTHAAQNVGDILEALGNMNDESRQQLHDVVVGISGLNLYDPDETEQATCRLEDIVAPTFEQVMLAFEDLGLDYRAVRIAFQYFKIDIILMKTRLEQHPERDEDEQDSLDFIKLLEQSGFLTIDPVGLEMYVDALNLLHGSGHFVEIVQGNSYEPPSPVPLDVQCTLIANKFLKVWHTEMSELNPNIVSEIRQNIIKWTGLEISHDHQVRDMICEFMGMAMESEIDGMLQWLKDHGVLMTAFKTGYPYMMQGLNVAQDFLSTELDRLSSLPEIVTKLNDDMLGLYSALLDLIGDIRTINLDALVSENDLDLHCDISKKRSNIITNVNKQTRHLLRGKDASHVQNPAKRTLRSKLASLLA